MARTQLLRERRQRGTLDPETTSTLYARLPEDAKAVFDEIADAAGVSLAVVLERVARHVERDQNGLPIWWDEPLAQQEELPLKSA